MLLTIILPSSHIPGKLYNPEGKDLITSWNFNVEAC